MNIINAISRVPNSFKVHAELLCTGSLFDLLKNGLQVLIFMSRVAVAVKRVHLGRREFLKFGIDRS